MQSGKPPDPKPLSRRGCHDDAIHIILLPLSLRRTLTAIVKPACHSSRKPSKVTIRRTLAGSGAATELREWSRYLLALQQHLSTLLSQRYYRLEASSYCKPLKTNLWLLGTRERSPKISVQSTLFSSSARRELIHSAERRELEHSFENRPLPRLLLRSKLQSSATGADSRTTVVDEFARR